MKTLLLLLALILTSTPSLSLELTRQQHSTITHTETLHRLYETVEYLNRSLVSKDESGLMLMVGIETTETKLFIKLAVSKTWEEGYDVLNDKVNIPLIRLHSTEFMKLLLTETDINKGENEKYFTSDNVVLQVIVLSTERNQDYVKNTYFVPVFNPYGNTDYITITRNIDLIYK